MVGSEWRSVAQVGKVEQLALLGRWLSRELPETMLLRA